MLRAKLLVASLAVPSGVQCPYFVDVTVPGADTSDPVMASRVFIDGVDHISLSPIDEDVANPGDPFVPISAMLDDGGAREIVMEHEVVLRCQRGRLGKIVYVTLVDSINSQPGAVGDTVSDGLYAVPGAFSFDEFLTPGCGSEWTVYEAVYTWEMRGIDFHGNEATMRGGDLRYTP